jgi:Uma2 family endonuclease
MSASLKPLTVEEFLAWERSQEPRYEFDGIQPVAMTGGSRAHNRVTTRLTGALVRLVKSPCEACGPDLKVLTPGRVRFPDASVVCATADEDDDADIVAPTVVFEVLSPSTALTDRRVKAIEYAGATTILVYVMLETDRAGNHRAEALHRMGGGDHRRSGRGTSTPGDRDNNPAGGDLRKVILMEE